MTTAHTSGPWSNNGQGDITGIEDDPDNGCVGLVDIASVYLRTVPGRTDANARLISAAPELLEAHDPEQTGPDFLDWIADRLVNVYGESPNIDFVLSLRKRAEMSRAAILKATGST